VARYQGYYRLYQVAAWHQFIILLGYATYLSLTPSPGELFESSWDKLWHAGGWFALTLSLRLAWPTLRLPWWAAFGLLLYSLLIEVLQHYSPNRQFDLYDLIANGIGILLAVAASRFVWPPVHRRLMTLNRSDP